MQREEMGIKCKQKTREKLFLQIEITDMKKLLNRSYDLPQRITTRVRIQNKR